MCRKGRGGHAAALYCPACAALTHTTGASGCAAACCRHSGTCCRRGCEGCSDQYVTQAASSTTRPLCAQDAIASICWQFAPSSFFAPSWSDLIQTPQTAACRSYGWPAGCVPAATHFPRSSMPAGAGGLAAESGQKWVPDILGAADVLSRCTLCWHCFQHCARITW